MMTFEWIEAEIMYENGTRAKTYTHRAKIHGGWLVGRPDTDKFTFVPDPEHEWDGNSLL